MIFENHCMDGNGVLVRKREENRATVIVIPVELLCFYSRMVNSLQLQNGPIRQDMADNVVAVRIGSIRLTMLCGWA